MTAQNHSERTAESAAMKSRRREIKTLLAGLMLMNAGLFFFGAAQHAGRTLGPFHEPRIVPATIVESFCGFSLVWGAVIVLGRKTKVIRWALISNFIALCGVLLGMAAPAVGAGPRTASNDLYHRIMLVLIGASLLVVFFNRFVVNKN